MANETKNVATIKVLGDAFVITAGFKFQTVKDLIKYGKDAALTLKDKETKDPYFRVNVGSHTEVSRYGVVFTNANKEGYAECTGFFAETGMSEENKLQFIKDKFAFAINHLNEVATQVETAEAELNSVMKVVDNAITMA